MDTVIASCGIVSLALFIISISMGICSEEYRKIRVPIVVINIVVPLCFYNKSNLYNSPEFQSSYRVATLEIKMFDAENDIVILEDANGFQYHFEGIEDWHIGDLVSCLMYTQDTPNVYDDEIVQKRYSGFNVERIGK